MTRVVLPAVDYDELSRMAAKFVYWFVVEHPRALIALPTGKTPRDMYRLLASRARAENADVSRLRFVGLDEFVGVGPSEPASFSAQLRYEILEPLGTTPDQARLLDGQAADLDWECAAHERFIRDAGGMDLAILGIGTNGHIAFNEPGTEFTSRTHVARLSPSTRGAQRDAFRRRVPREGLTLGIATIRDAKAILLMASGDRKANVLRRAFFSPPTLRLPASALQEHGQVTVIADAGALRNWREPDNG